MVHLIKQVEGGGGTLDTQYGSTGCLMPPLGKQACNALGVHFVCCELSHYGGFWQLEELFHAPQFQGIGKAPT